MGERPTDSATLCDGAMGKGVRICGVDPGLNVTGYAVVSQRGAGLSLVDAGVCRTDPKLALPDRLLQLREDILDVLEEHHPSALAVEQLYSHVRHPRTAILMGHARGVILCLAAERGIEVTHHGATHVKRYLTGNGHASKEQIQRAIRMSLGLKDDPEPADVADAIAIALCRAGLGGEATLTGGRV